VSGGRVTDRLDGERPGPAQDLTLEQRVARLEAIEDIRALKSVYHTYIDDTQFDQVAALFTNDAYVKMSYLMPGGRPWVGKDEISAAFASMANTSLQSQVKQFLHNHVVEVTGETTATGTGLLIAFYGVGEQSFYVVGKYTEDYERVAGRWLFKKMVLGLYFTVPLQAGWAGHRRHYLVNSGENIPDYAELRPNPAI
jgi:ketosteroid isomerase-like protein